MAAEEGNDYWLKRKTHGRKKQIKTPKEFWKHACGYFQYCDDNPWMKNDVRGKNAIAVQIPTARPYTWSGLEVYIHEQVGLVRIDDYKANKDGRYDEYADIIHMIDKIIYTQKFEGAAVGAFNANIIARDLGLADKKTIAGDIEQPLFPDLINSIDENTDEISENTEHQEEGEE